MMKAFLSVIFFFAFVSVIVASGSAQCDDQPYNNAWKVLESLESGYVRYVTYNTSVRCYSLTRKVLNGTTNTAIYDGSYNTKDDATYKTARETLNAGLPCPSTLALRYDNGCRFWIGNGATEDQAQACKTYFDKECGTTQYVVYDEASCSKVPKN